MINKIKNNRKLGNDFFGPRVALATKSQPDAKKSFSQFSKNKKGFSLPEMIVYISLLFLILAVLVNSLVLLLKANRTNQSAWSIETSATLAMERMTRDIRTATSVDAGNSVLNSNPGQITINTNDVNGNPVVEKFYIKNGVIWLQEGGADTGPLMLGSTQVTNLIFRQINTGRSTAIKIEMTIIGGQGDALKTKNFYSTIVLRNSYTQQ